MSNMLAKPFVREFLRISLAMFISPWLLGFIITLLVSEDPIGAYQSLSDRSGLSFEPGRRMDQGIDHADPARPGGRAGVQGKHFQPWAGWADGAGRPGCWCNGAFCPAAGDPAHSPGACCCGHLGFLVGYFQAY
jgi:hypothetical protein